MAKYEGMRWYKCDLQMQTPADAPHWRGQPMGESAAEKAAAADAYIRRCYEVGLEAIAITDHNFLSKGFIPFLQASIHKFTGEFGYRITLFPGFECEADVGKGVHVLGIFEPRANLDEIDHILTECGVGYPRVQAGVLTKSTYRLPELLSCIQRLNANGQQCGLVVMPHAMKDDGLFDKSKLNDWLQQTEYLNPELLAVEVPKPVHEMSDGWRRLFDAGDDCDIAWRRTRPIACIMSSDNKALTPEENVDNYIGMRYTWVKMSEPSIEALRQAFLDHKSRVRLQTGRPSDDERHPRIVSISVKGAAFVEDQTIHLSPNLNCVIGGRGSGKSTLLEYLRFALVTDEVSREEQETALGRKRAQLLDTIAVPGAEVRVTFQAEGGVADTLVYTPGNSPELKRRIEGREVNDLPTVIRQLQAQFFSQGELSRMTGDGAGQGQVLALIDASSGAPLLELQMRESNLQSRLKTLFQARRDEQRLVDEIKVGTQEVTELERQLQARESVQGDSTKSQLALQARRFLDDLVKAGERDFQQLSDMIAVLSRAQMQIPNTAKDWPEAEWFKAVAEKNTTIRQKLLTELNEASQHFKLSLSQATGAEASKIARDAIQFTQDRFKAACAENGIHPDDIARLQELEESRQRKINQVEERTQELVGVKSRADEFPTALAELHAVWRQQFEIRRATGHAMEASVASQTVRVTTEFMADKTSFTAAWRRLAPKDGRGKLARRWDEIGDDLYISWRNRGTEVSPWETVEAARTDSRAIPYLYGELADDLQPALVSHLDSGDVRPIWESIRISRINDGVDVELRRDDGSTAGTMSGALSEGQRNTVLLNLMLARGTGPIVIDQPEDELDSSFIYKTLVKDLRATKEKRQLIVVTHNANLPVNGDAEFIYALEARDGQGKTLAEGGLDRAPVARAVLDIMEGSDQAFKRRSEKYHF